MRNAKRPGVSHTSFLRGSQRVAASCIHRSDESPKWITKVELRSLLPIILHQLKDSGRRGTQPPRSSPSWGNCPLRASISALEPEEELLPPRKHARNWPNRADRTVCPMWQRLLLQDSECPLHPYYPNETGLAVAVRLDGDCSTRSRKNSGQGNADAKTEEKALGFVKVIISNI